MQSRLTRRQFVRGSAAGVAAGLSLSHWCAAQDSPGAWALENPVVKYVVGPDACSRHFIDKQTGRDYCGGNGKIPLARVKKNNQWRRASTAQANGDRLTLGFGDAGAKVVLKGIAHPQHLVFEVVEVVGEGIEELAIIDIPLTLKGTPDETFAACAVALDLRTNVAAIPQPTARLHATCCARFGMVGAKTAVAAAPADKLRSALQETITLADELPHSAVGGPWALGQPINQGSYLFNFGDMTVEKADDWIKLAKTLGMNQIDFHGGGSFRFGDCRPNPKTYPEGFKSLKAVIDKLHAAGISAGLHTYAFFINKSCPWVTPKPDPRLAKFRTLTLAADLPLDAKSLAVVESTKGMSATTGFFVRNSATLCIDDELITFTSPSQEAPFVFTGITRGACGTQPAAHAKGAKVHHLKECFGLFVPDPETTLLEEVANATATAFNACGFDMIYLDALDGEDILGGGKNSWHYGSRFVYEICKRLKKPALMEMSTFHHHLWCVRSRLGAWDHPTRSHKKFIDTHCQANQTTHRMFLPAQLGWWALKSWSDQQGEPTFSDDIEYLMARCLGTDTGFALMGINPDTIKSPSALPRLADIVRRYEDLRHSGKVPDSIKSQLRAPGAEFTLVGNLQEGWEFRPRQYAKHKVESAEPWSSQWQVTNSYAAQPLRLRIETLLAAGPYDAPDNPVVVGFNAADELPLRAAAGKVQADWKPVREIPAKEAVKFGDVCGRLTATNGRGDRKGAWAKLEKKFSPPRNLSSHQGFGVWVYGDGQGEVLNLQLLSPHHMVSGISDHYIVVDFTGWRYFELVENEGDRYSDYQWPYPGGYAIYRETIHFNNIETVGLWCNNLPVGKPATCCLSPIKALPLVSAKLTNPTLSVGGKTLVLPVEIATGQYLELNAANDCTLYGPKGELVRKVELPGPLPVLQPGENQIAFQAETQPGLRPRARVTVITEGAAIH